MAAKAATTVEHTGFKFLALILTLVLSMFWLLFNFFTWMTGLTTGQLTSFGLGYVGLFIFLLFAFLWQIIKHFMAKVYDMYVPRDYKDLGYKHLVLVIALFTGTIWTLMNFFQWLTVGVAGEQLLQLSLGLVGITLAIFFAFVFEIAWAFFHKVSDV